VLVSTVELLTRARRGKNLGLIGTENLKLDWPAVIARKNDIVARWSKSKNGAPAKLGIPVLDGTGRFVGPHEISVNGRNYSAEKFVIATGSRPARPVIPDAELAITRDEFIHLTEQPKNLVIVGAGFIGLEFGFALSGCHALRLPSAWRHDLRHHGELAESNRLCKIRSGIRPT
jgi:glutathione reductase (NADPH)